MKIQVVGLAVAGLLLAGGAWGQGTLGLKRGGERRGISWAKPKSRQAQRAHYLIELRLPPTPELLRSIEGNGQKVVSYVPVNGFILAVEGEPRLDGLDVVSAGPLEPAEKLSREIGRSRAGKRGYVVEFHGDIPWEERRALIQESGLELRDHPDLVGDQMLVRGTVGQLESLVDWDEVAYVFPASNELMNGSPLIGCAGASTEAGPVGALVQTVGEGWDGPGRGRATLQFAYRSFSQKATTQAQQAEVFRALREWSGVIQVDFVEGNDPSAPRTIGILWGRGAHGDGFPFDGAGRVLAHTFYPAPPNSEPIAGDLHFDEDENWQVGRDIDIYSVALHELGHALGLGHSDVPGSVMYAYYRRAEQLTAEDIGAARGLYAAREVAGTTPPANPATPTTPTNPTTPTTPTNPTPANPTPTNPTPTNPTTPTTPPTTPPTAPTTPALFAVELIAPTGNLQTTAMSMPMFGMATGVTGTPVVRWVTDRGMWGEGTATLSGAGTFAWNIPTVRLVPGVNTVTVLVSDSTRRTVGRSIQVQVAATTTDPAAAPRLSLTNPATYSFLWPSESLSLEGTASSAVGISRVSWRVSNGTTGTATGTTTWTMSRVRLVPGFNTITLTARDTQGRETEQVVTVFRY
jgi:hypothetical protein